MTVEDVFGLVLRIAGLVLIGCGFFDAWHGVLMLTGLPIPSHYPIETDFIGGVTYAAPGAALFLGADAITRVAYRGRRDRD